MKTITNDFCNYNALDLLTKCRSMLIIKFLKRQHCPVYSKTCPV